MIYDGELPIVIFGDHTRCIKYIDFQFAQGADGVKVLKPKQFWNDKAFYYAMQSIVKMTIVLLTMMLKFLNI